jgi:predicted site-specific integrase-resolvase
MTTKEVADKYGVAGITVRIWCKQNNIKRKLGKQGVMEYVLTDKDIKNFENRKPKGRPKKA